MLEMIVDSTSSSSNIHEVVDDNSNHYRSMVIDAIRISHGYSRNNLRRDKETNVDAVRFFKLLKDFNEMLWDGFTNYSKLLVIVRVFTIKSNYSISEADYDTITEWANNILPKGNRLNENLYLVKPMMKTFGLRYPKTNMFLNFCMLYYGEDVNLTKCKTCGHAKYKSNTNRGRTYIIYKKFRYFPITRRLQKLFISLKISEHMECIIHIM